MEPAGKENTSTSWPAIFLSKNTVHDTSGPGQHDSDDTNRGKVSQKGVRSRQEAENSGGRDQERGREAVEAQMVRTGHLSEAGETWFRAEDDDETQLQ